MKIFLNEILKNKEIDDMIKQFNNSSYYVDKNEINEFYLTQMDWKDKIKKKNNSLYMKKQEEKNKEEKKFLSHKLNIDKNSKKIAEIKLKIYYTLNNSTSSKIKTNDKNSIFERLYRDGKLHEKKINRLVKSYYNPFFKPNINQSYSFSKSYTNMKSKSQNITKNKNKNRNENEINNLNKLYNNKKNKNSISKNLSNITKK